MKITWRQTTQIVLGAAIVLLLAYDLVVYLAAGNEATISAVAQDAIKDWPMLGILAGCLVGHIAWSMTRKKKEVSNE